MKNKKKTFSFLLILIMFTLLFYFGKNILKDKLIISKVTSRHLENVLVCPSNMDLNLDEVIDVNDKIYLREFLASKENNELIYDFNADEIIDSSDIEAYVECYNKYYDYTFFINDNNIIKQVEDLNIISRIPIETTVSDFIQLFTVGDMEVSILDDSDNIKEDNEMLATGDKLIIKKQDIVVDRYNLSVLGDVLGIGQLTNDGAKEIASHIIDGDILLFDENLLAADINGDMLIKMNDVMFLVSELEQ